LRIGDSEREAAASVLREHYAAGRLTFEEFNQRLDAAFAATTQSQLRLVTRDLPHAGMPTATGPLTAAGPYRERARQRCGSAPSRGFGMLSAVIALIATLLLVVSLHLDFLWPGRLVIFLAIFAAVRTLMRRIFRQANGARGRYPRRPYGGGRRGPWR
jgi:hypothetical protein